MVVGVGIDTVDVPRFREMLERTPAMLDKLFTEGEKAYGLKHNDSAPSLAVRFAAKEATMKALGVGLGAFGFHDVEVVSLESGAPELRVTGAAEVLAKEKGVQSWKISLSHTCSVANAVVIAE
jgi:holo-[acyl-carrier protein] synthase